MADNWQETTSQQVKLIADRLNELLSGGLDLVHTGLGVDLGLKPELYPPWVILLAAGIGLVLMVALWASACRGLFRRRPTIIPVDDSKPAATKPTRTEEPKKKKRKMAEKRVQSNGRAADEPGEEEVQVVEEDVPHHPPAAEAKSEKALEVKKGKKKPKQAVKEAKTATADGKEPEEGTWETKVSNKEKREQRRKDKTPGDASGSPGGGDPPPKHTPPPEQPKATASLPAGQKKKKAETSKARAEKGDVAPPQADSSEVAEVSAGWTDLAVKAPVNAIGPGPDHWAPNQEAALGTPAPTERCSLETEGSWTVIDVTEVSLAEGSASSAAVDPQPGTGVVDEWSGLSTTHSSTQ